MRDKNTDSAAESTWSLDAAGSKASQPVSSERPSDHKFPTKNGVLTQAEIEFLLRPELQDGAGVPVEPETIEQHSPAVFDTPSKPAATTPEEQAAKTLAARLSFMVAQGSGMKAAIRLSGLAPKETHDLAGLMMGKAGAVACFGRSESETSILVCLPSEFADGLIAHACGARDSTGRIGNGWSLSAIDCALLEQLLAPVSAAFGSELSLLAIETDIPYVTSLLPAGDVMVADYVVEAPGLKTELAVIRSHNSVRSQMPVPQRVEKSPITAVVTARIASLSVPISRLTSLKAGSTLLLGLPSDQPVEVLSGHRDGPVAFEGQIGRKGNKVAVKITRKVRGALT
ncbi:MAG: hypothetical protein Hens3KO_22430 [Henriciella sp.]